MSTVGRLNIDVTATTGKFDAAMAGVRRQIGGVGRAGAAAGAVGGVSMPGFGALGAVAGLSGPLIAVTAGLAALTGAMKDRDTAASKAGDALDLALTKNLSFAQASRLMGVGQQLGTGGESILQLVQASTTGSGLSAIRAESSDTADLLAKAGASGDFNRVLNVLQMLSESSGRMEIAKALGGSGDDFLRLRRVSLGLNGFIDPAAAEDALRQQNFDAQNPGFMQRFFNWLIEFFGGGPAADVSIEQTRLLREIAAQQGPGI
jgi:hypothetical protein